MPLSPLIPGGPCRPAVPGGPGGPGGPTTCNSLVQHIFTIACDWTSIQVNSIIVMLSGWYVLIKFWSIKPCNTKLTYSVHFQHRSHFVSTGCKEYLHNYRKLTSPTVTLNVKDWTYKFTSTSFKGAISLKKINTDILMYMYLVFSGGVAYLLWDVTGLLKNMPEHRLQHPHQHVFPPLDLSVSKHQLKKVTTATNW